MGLLLHAITARVDAARPGVVTEQGLSAWTSQVSDAQAFTREDMLAHHRLVTEVFSRAEACLPARFPTLVEDEEALRRQLVAREAALRRQLEQVRGACELAVTATWASPDEVPEDVAQLTPGRRYLLRRAASERKRQRAEALADLIEQYVDGALLAARRTVCPSPRIALSLALLVKRASSAEVKARLGRGLGLDVRILVNGPWPPYSFADARSTG